MSRPSNLSTSGLSRRIALGSASLAAVTLGLGRGQHAVAAQDATPVALGNHPVVGTWIVDRNPADSSEIPTYNVFTADGGIIDPPVGGVGVWEATGPDTANFTLTGTIAELGAYFVARGAITVDAGGGTAANTYSSTIVAADGTILDQFTETDGTATYVRLRVEPQTAVGQPLAGFPAWTPAPERETAASPEEHTVQVSLTDMAIASSVTSFTVGMPYTFVVTNNGQAEHEMVIEHRGDVDIPMEVDGQESEAADIAPGKTKTLVWTFTEPGEYQLACHEPAHYEAGMVLPIEVTS